MDGDEDARSESDGEENDDGEEADRTPTKPFKPNDAVEAPTTEPFKPLQRRQPRGVVPMYYQASRYGRVHGEMGARLKGTAQSRAAASVIPR